MSTLNFKNNRNIFKKKNNKNNTTKKSDNIETR